ncbi:MAG: SOS response-associated peptidase, partial [Desulfohalobiaceae bacterium]|nr:SOS response-associated peptidase [Desulfohalobiaceae bacterium]
LWEHWQDEEADRKIDSCTIVTTRANEAVSELHDRMPVIIGNDDLICGWIGAWRIRNDCWRCWNPKVARSW